MRFAKFLVDGCAGTEAKLVWHEKSLGVAEVLLLSPWLTELH
jgi:hypothetical protein